MNTFDAATVQGTGAFLVGQLERLDPTLYEPLAAVTWGRDINLRSDVSLADDMSSFATTSYAASGTPKPNGKNWVGKDSNALAGVNVDLQKKGFPLTQWAMELGWTVYELAAAQQLNRPIDVQKFDGMNLKWQMDTDAQVYVGDDELGIKGLVNQPGIATDTSSRTWSDILNDTSLSATQKATLIGEAINSAITHSWKASGYSVVPDKLLLPPDQYGLITQQITSDAGVMSIMDYLRNNTLSNTQNGRPLDIQPVKWLTGAGAKKSNRMVAYTNRQNYVRFPMVPLRRAPLTYSGIWQKVAYYGKLGAVEVVYPETMSYYDGI